jgi:hypothetical protein
MDNHGCNQQIMHEASSTTEDGRTSGGVGIHNQFGLKSNG